MGWFDFFSKPARAPEGEPSGNGGAEPEPAPVPEPLPEQQPEPEQDADPTPSAAGNGLDVIVGGILKALADAQETADAAAARRLSSPDFSGRALPTPVIDRVDFQLCFAVRKHTLTETARTVSVHVIDEASLKDAAKRAAREAAQQAAAHIAPADSPQDADAEETDTRREVAANLNSRPSLHWLAEGIQQALRQHKAEWLATDGTVDTAKAAALMDEAVRAALAEHPEIPQHWLSVSEAEGGPGVLGFDLSAAADGLRSTTRHEKAAPTSHLDVVIDAEELAKLPERAVQTLKLAVVMHERTAVAVPQGDHQPTTMKE